jgi:hypothetical protein
VREKKDVAPLLDSESDRYYDGADVFSLTSVLTLSIWFILLFNNNAVI